MNVWHRSVFTAMAANTAASSRHEVPAQPTPVERDDSTFSPGAWGGQLGSLATRYGTWCCAAGVAVIAVVSLHRSGVALADIIRFSGFWLVAVLCPGAVVSRSLLGVRTTIAEDLAVAAASGLALEALSWIVGVATGIGEVARFWWVPVLVLGVAAPQLRRRVLVRVAGRVSLGYAAALAATTAVALIRIDVSRFRLYPLPPKSGAVYLDLWWHLSFVQEMSRYQAPQTPQVVGEPLNYHFFAHVHMGVASRLSGVRPEVVLLRLWIVPIVVLSICLLSAAVVVLTKRMLLGPVAAFVAFGSAGETFLWPNVTAPIANPIVFESPSQVLANVAAVGALYAIALLVRSGTNWRTLLWLALIVAGGAGTKSTVIPVLIGGTAVALVAAVFLRHHQRTLFAGLLGFFLAVQVAVLMFAAGTDGGDIVLLGFIRTISPYKEVVADHGLRTINSGLLLDSISSPKAIAVALITVGIVLVTQGAKIVGSLRLTTAVGRADMMSWWLAGAFFSGVAATFAIDHIGLSQGYFFLTVGPFGAALAMCALADGLDRLGEHGARVVAMSVGFGALTALIIEAGVSYRTDRGTHSPLDKVLFPLVLLVPLFAVGAWLWRRYSPGRGIKVAAVLGAVAASIGVSLPSEVRAAVESTGRWTQPVRYTVDSGSPDFVSHPEYVAALWLARHSDRDDVFATNAHCRSTPQTPSFCDSRSAWLTGISGRRAVLESWGFTPQAQAKHGHGNRTWLAQSPAFPARYAINQGVFEDGDQAALNAMISRYHVRYLVAVTRAGPNKIDRLTGIEQVFNNSAVQIYRVLDR